ncbi:MAG: hypothetical protein O3A85_03070 [Proteobacteria bacterium]|nr:hypothetical protein [Pseudomonadota bacterium]
MTAASAGHVPAQRDLGRFYLQRSSTKDKVRGYAWLLVAKRSGLDVSQLLEEAGRHFGADNTTDAQELSKTLPIGRKP